MREHKTHYDVIPYKYFCGNILDVGSRDGENQQNSTNWYLIENAINNNRYLTLDIDESPYVNLVGDIFDLGPTLIHSNSVFDVVMAIHILEHVIVERWPALIGILKDLVAPGGTLIIGTPYIEVPPMERVAGPDHLRHVVYWIDCRDIIRHLDDTCMFRIYRGPYSMALMCYWRKEQ
jgi:SAM-dependent methyltransferase